MKIIDVSKYQPNIDYKKVKAAGVEGAILRCGITYWGKQNCGKDECFEKHYAGFKAVGIPVGVYYYSAADTVTVARKEAAYVIDLLKGKQLELPVYYDVEEENRMGKLNKETLTRICKTFCDALEKAGYFVGVYANTNYFLNKLDHARLANKYTLWLADYRGSNANQSLKRDIWQYTSTGRVDGIAGNVDMNECYRNFPEIIKLSGCNGYSKGNTAPSPAPKPTPKPPVTSKTYTVKPGDSFWKIAEKTLGDGNRYGEIAAHNGMKPTDTIYPGQVLKVPGAKKSVDEIAKEVIRGDWGNGEERKKRLKAAGYDYAEVQKKVNKLS